MALRALYRAWQGSPQASRAPVSGPACRPVPLPPAPQRGDRSRPRVRAATGSAPAAQERQPQAQQQQQAQHRPQQQAVDDALQEAAALLDSIKAAGALPTLASSDLGFTDFGYLCDDSGCVLAVQQQDDSQRATTPPFERMLSGANWKLGMVQRAAEPLYSDTAESLDASQDGDGLMHFVPPSSSGASAHAALLAGPGWHVYLGADEFASYVHMLGQLRMAVASLRFQGLWNAGGSERPPSRAKWAGPDARLTAVYAPGDPGFSLESTFVFEGGRCITTRWPADVTAGLVAELDETLGFRPLAVRGT